MMDDNTRDDLLIRLDEKSASIFRELKDQNKHLEAINGKLGKNEQAITALNITVYGKEAGDGLCDEVKKLRTDITKLLLIGAIVAGATGGSVAGLLKLFS